MVFSAAVVPAEVFSAWHRHIVAACTTICVCLSGDINSRNPKPALGAPDNPNHSLSRQGSAQCLAEHTCTLTLDEVRHNYYPNLSIYRPEL